MSIPNDGEPLNAASVAQMVKVLADFEAWLLSPRAKASAWAEPIALWRNAALKRMFGIDHLGFPAGRLNHWRECWRAAENTGTGFATGLTSYVSADKRWRFDVNRTTNGIGRIAFIDPELGWPASRRMQIETCQDGGAYSFAVHTPVARFATDVSFAMEWDAVVNDFGTREIVMGFNDPLDVNGGGAVAQFHANGAGGTNYFAETYAAGTPTTTDTGIAMNTGTRRFRIEYHAANMDDAGVERVMFFIDGALVADHTTNLPSAAASPLARPWFTQIYNGATGNKLWVTPLTFSSNLFADAF